MALVITLIMLAIITVVTVVFLATARRQRQTTTVRLDQTAAEQAADIAYQRALAEVITNVFAARANNTNAPNLMAFDFLVSRRGPLVPWVNVTNASGSIGNYLDLNRDGQFNDPNDTTNYPYGDPEWIAINDKSWLPGGRDNRALKRTAYIVLPAGKSLDINTIHNAASPDGGFIRNQGFGPWEINLAAFLAELNPDIWYPASPSPDAYSYGPFPTPTTSGSAFADAHSIVEFRRGWDPATRPNISMEAVFPSVTVPPYFPPSSIDAYGDGNNGSVLGVNPFLADDDTNNNLTKIRLGHWYGSDPTNHWFHPQEFFDNISYKVTNDFLLNLYYAITGSPSASIPGDPVAFYKMLAQLSTDTGSDYHERINLNYADGHVGEAVTNFVSWTNSPGYAEAFFTNVAQRIFLVQSNEFNAPGQVPLRSILQIPIYPTNLYSSAIHRILQLAANIYDATHTNGPSVFRPIFGGGEIPGVNYIIGFAHDNRRSTLDAWLASNTNNIPLVIGARKGYPNFNEFSVRTDVMVTRKMEVTRAGTAPGSALTGTNLMYVMGISNSLFVEAWNSYNRNFQRPVTLDVISFTTVTLTNDRSPLPQNQFSNIVSISKDILNWRRFDVTSPSLTNSFILAVETNFMVLNPTSGVFRFADNTFIELGENAYETVTDFPMLYSVITVSNWMTYVMRPKDDPDRILDFVTLNNGQVIDVYQELIGSQNPYRDLPGTPSFVVNQWNTNRSGSATGPTDGMLSQLGVSLGLTPSTDAEWRAFSPLPVSAENDKQAAIDAFRNFMGLAPLYGSTFRTNLTTKMQAPFNPSAKLIVQASWQANDPLVHYHSTDLEIAPTNQTRQYLKPSEPATNLPPASRLRLNDRYSPWAGNPTDSTYPENSDRSIKDPGVYTSDYWQFPSNKLASVGLLGRVHRGTPWQTVYFKSEIADPTAWVTENHDIRSHPTNDWRLVDMFTTALDERMSQGMMSVNQTNMESWSALLSGVVVLSNSTEVPILMEPPTYTEMFIEPWGGRPIAQSQFAQIWTNIYAFQRAYGRPLESAGDLLRLPVLTVESPFLNVSDPDQRMNGIDDFAYEQIPQQILSLLRVGQPRFVIYAYGQALKPAAIDPGTGEVSNYQVTAEYATRTVVRVEGDPRSRVRAVVESFNVLPAE